MFHYKVKEFKVIDGDTVDLVIDLGFSLTIKERFRLQGINAPETRTRDLEEKQRGLAAKHYLRDCLLFSKSLTAQTAKNKGKYGRWICILFDSGMNLNKHLVETGHAISKEY